MRQVQVDDATWFRLATLADRERITIAEYLSRLDAPKHEGPYTPATAPVEMRDRFRSPRVLTLFDLWMSGASDSEIGAAIGKPNNWVAAVRSQYRLRSNRRVGAPKRVA